MNAYLTLRYIYLSYCRMNYLKQKVQNEGGSKRPTALSSLVKVKYYKLSLGSIIM